MSASIATAYEITIIEVVGGRSVTVATKNETGRIQAARTQIVGLRLKLHKYIYENVFLLLLASQGQRHNFGYRIFGLTVENI